MPYPILSLSYGLQKRLHSLASPFEQCDLQIAAGFEKHYVKPLVRFRKMRCTDIGTLGCFDSKSERLAFETDPANEDVWLILDAKHVKFWNSFDTNLPHMQRLLITNADTMSFDHFSITEDVVETLASKFVKPIECFHVQDIQFRMDFTFSTLFKHLPHVTDMNSVIDIPWRADNGFRKTLPHSNWVEEILKSGKTDLKSMYFMGEPKDLFDFTSEQMHQLLHRQNLELRIQLSYFPWRGTDENGNTIDLEGDDIRAKLYQHFRPAEKNGDYRIYANGCYLV